MKQLLFLLGLLLATTSVADDVGPKQSKIRGPIIVPMVPITQEEQVQPDDLPAPRPKPEPGPSPVTVLKYDHIYVIEWTEPLLVLASPAGLVNIEKDTGPGVKLWGKFADGRGVDVVERRVVDSPFVYIITPAKAGKIELLLIPFDAESPEDVARYPLTVMGLGPNPPPIPDPAPEPGPSPEPDPTPTPVKAENVRICIVEDVLNRNPETAAVLNALVGWTAFADAGNQYRLYDKSTKEPAGLAAVTAAGTISLPVMVVYDLKSGELLTATPLPGSFSGFKTIVEGLVK